MNVLPDFISEYSALFHAIKKIVPPSMKIYLVGGAVRDILLGRKIRDFDFSAEGLVRPIGKNVANEMNGAYYVLDDEREMVRVIIDDENMGQFDVDIALMSGDDISDDLRERDFTLNAMAIDLKEPPELVDPLNGLDDFNNRVLHMCSPESLKNDPLRALRAVRMSLEFGLTMDEELINEMKSVRELMSRSSMERYRDETFKIVRLNRNSEAVKLFEEFGFLDYLFPGISTPCSEEKIGKIENADRFSVMMTRHQNEETSDDAFMAYASQRLGNYKPALKAFFDKTLALYHSRRMLLGFASIVCELSESTDMIKNWCTRLAFSSSETAFVLSAIQSLQYLKVFPNIVSCSDVDIYRYFRLFKEGGIAGLSLYLADQYSKRDNIETYNHWCDHVVFVQNMISAYFSRYMEVIDPKPLLSGNDIQALLQIQAGPLVGKAKNALIEAQIKGSVRNVAEAEFFLRQYVK